MTARKTAKKKPAPRRRAPTLAQRVDNLEIETRRRYEAISAGPTMSFSLIDDLPPADANGAGTAASAPSIPGRLAAADQSVNRLFEVFEILEKKLTPVLGPMPPNRDDGVSVADPVAGESLSAKVFQLDCKLGHLINWINTVTARTEL